MVLTRLTDEGQRLRDESDGRCARAFEGALASPRRARPGRGPPLLRLLAGAMETM